MVVDSKHGGYSSMVRRLADQTFDDEDPRLLLGETVREVQLDADVAQCHPESSASNSIANESERIYVRTAAGHEYRAQYCIITFSVYSLHHYGVPSKLTFPSIQYLFIHVQYIFICVVNTYEYVTMYICMFLSVCVLTLSIYGSYVKL